MTKDKKRACIYLLRALCHNIDVPAEAQHDGWILHEIYSCKRSDDKRYPMTYFIKLNFNSSNAMRCATAKKGKHSESGKVSYSVNVRTGRVSQKCFSSKCQRYNGGKAVLHEGDAHAASSDEDEEDDDYEEEDYNKDIDEDDAMILKAIMQTEQDRETSM